MLEQITEGNYSRFGATQLADGICFTFEADFFCSCSVRLYDKRRRGVYRDICVPKEYCVGAVRSVIVQGIDPAKYDYNYIIDGIELVDPYAARIVGREKWADQKRLNASGAVRSGFAFDLFDWEEDHHPLVRKTDMLLYKLHVRGFTKDAGGSVKHKGTFAGIVECIPYLKELGITTVELMPAYEFEELLVDETSQGQMDFSNWSPQAVAGYQMLQTKESEKQQIRINYWGYGEGDYFAPKASYAAGADPVREMKEMIKALHTAGIECILEMNFKEQENPNFAVEVLRHWVLNYHVDGFHLLASGQLIAGVICDVMLFRSKIFASNFPSWAWERADHYPHLYVYNDDFLYVARKQINHQDANLVEFSNQLRKQHKQIGFVNYVATNNGFTLADVFSYATKHNEENGEDSTDGNDYNYSYNCGVEGATRKKSIKQSRQRHMLLALASVFFSQGVPLLLAGDEFGNSQNGNNNAYCQDNKTGWVNWSTRKKNQAYFESVKELISLRKAHSVLRSEAPMHQTDYLSRGLPDLSYHSSQAWCTQLYPSMQAFGVAYCGAYAESAGDLYIGWNFSDAKTLLALPNPSAVEKWVVIYGDGCVCDELLSLPGSGVTMLVTKNLMEE